jgi:hypothetical protein
MRVSLVAGAVVAACVVAGSVQASLLVYDPTLGTLPQAQGWNFSGSYNAPSTVAGGQMTYGPTTVGGTTFWEHNPTDTIDFSTDTVFIEAEIRLTGSDYGNFSGFRRAGFSLLISDDVGRWIIADLGDNRISLGNDNNRTSDPSAVFDLTTSFHLVRLEAGPTGGRLYVDGVEQLTLALGTGRTGGAEGWFGDGTTLANANQTEVRRAAYIPAPGAAALGLATGLVGLRRRR